MLDDHVLKKSAGGCDTTIRPQEMVPRSEDRLQLMVVTEVNSPYTKGKSYDKVQKLRKEI